MSTDTARMIRGRGWHFGKTGLEMQKVGFGYFESMLNTCGTAQR